MLAILLNTETQQVTILPGSLFGLISKIPRHKFRVSLHKAGWEEHHPMAPIRKKSDELLKDFSAIEKKARKFWDDKDKEIVDGSGRIHGQLANVGNRTIRASLYGGNSVPNYAILGKIIRMTNVVASLDPSNLRQVISRTPVTSVHAERVGQIFRDSAKSRIITPDFVHQYNGYASEIEQQQQATAPASQQPALSNFNPTGPTGPMGGPVGPPNQWAPTAPPMPIAQIVADVTQDARDVVQDIIEKRGMKRVRPTRDNALPGYENDAFPTQNNFPNTFPRIEVI